MMAMPQGKKKGLSTKKFDRYVTKVKSKGGAKNPYAICNASQMVTQNLNQMALVASFEYKKYKEMFLDVKVRLERNQF